MTDTFGGPYGSFCDRLWLDWLADRLPPSAFGGGAFDPKSAPEPWIEFRAGSDPLVAVTTNPGGSMEHQSHEAVVGGTSPIIKPSQTYREATQGLGHFYEMSLKRSPAGHRIKAFLRLAESAGYKGLLGVEACPFHSANLPNKPKLVRAVESNSNSLLREYTEHLRAFLTSHHVVGLSAISSTVSLTATGTQLAMRSSIWLPWFAALIGLDPSQATHVELTRKDLEGRPSTVTAAGLVATVNGRRKALVLMMGGNRLPGEGGLAALAGALRRNGHDAG